MRFTDPGSAVVEPVQAKKELNMFAMTSGAALHLAERLAVEQVEKAFTFAREGHGWRLQLCDTLAGDVVIHHDDTVVMVLERDVASQLANRRLELSDTVRGPRLRMRQVAQTAGQIGTEDQNDE
jgi:hypothetical protein